MCVQTVQTHTTVVHMGLIINILNSLTMRSSCLWIKLSYLICFVLNLTLTAAGQFNQSYAYETNRKEPNKLEYKGHFCQTHKRYYYGNYTVYILQKHLLRNCKLLLKVRSLNKSWQFHIILHCNFILSSDYRDILHHFLETFDIYWWLSTGKSAFINKVLDSGGK